MYLILPSSRSRFPILHKLESGYTDQPNEGRASPAQGVGRGRRRDMLPSTFGASQHVNCEMMQLRRYAFMYVKYL